MPIERVKQTVAKTKQRIQRRWTREEAQRRQVMAELMQVQLFTALGFQPAKVSSK